MRKIDTETTMQIIQLMTNNSLEMYKRNGSKASMKALAEYRATVSQNKKGVIFVSPSKEELADGKGYIMTSYETLNKKFNQLSHWTPNTFRGGTYYDFKERIIKGHTKDNLKQINAFGFDIDTKNVDLYAIYLGCEELGLPRPNLLLETPRGFQFFFILETPFYIHAHKDYKALRVAERIAANMKKALTKYVPVDPGCNPFGFFRIPNQSNIKDFDDKPVNTKLLMSWSQDFEVNEKVISINNFVADPNASALDYTSSDWYKTLLNVKNIHSGLHGSSRNNTIFTLALANFASGVSLERTYDELDQFNSYLESPLSKSEFERIVKSAFSGKYKGVKREHVQNLLDTWTDGQASFKSNSGWYKFKKERKDRIRSHYSEWENDIVNYLDTIQSAENPFLETSLKTLSNTLGIALSSLKEVLKRSSKIIRITVGIGRKSKTKLTTRSLLFRSFLYARKKQLKQVQMTFTDLLPGEGFVLEYSDFPYLTEELRNYLELIEALPGASPPEKLIS